MLALEGLLPRICHAEKRVQGGRLSERQPGRSVDNEHAQCPVRAGDEVRVYSRCAEAWVDAEVVDVAEGRLMRVEYRVRGHWCGKTLPLGSLHLAVHGWPPGELPEEVDPGLCQGSRRVLPRECRGDPGTVMSR